MNKVDANNDFELSLEEFMDPNTVKISQEWIAKQGQNSSSSGGIDSIANNLASDLEGLEFNPAGGIFSKADQNGDKKLTPYELKAAW